MANGILFNKVFHTIIRTHYRIIIAVCIQILVCQRHRSIHQCVSTVCIDETSVYRVIVSAAAIIKAGFAVVIVTSIAEGVSIENVRVSGKVSSVNTAAPSIILIPRYLGACFAEKSNGSIRI